MVTYALGVVAHPARAGQAIRLRKQVRADVVSFDHAGIGGKANHMRVLNMLAGSGKDWAVVLEDDAIPCDDFHAHLEQALADAPSPLVSLYLGTGRWAGTVPAMHEPKVRELIEQADRDGAHWITGNMWHAVGYAIRQDVAEQLLDGLKTIDAPIDQAIGMWARLYGHSVAYTWPSLVDHRDEQRLVNATEPHVPRHAWRVRARV